MAATASSRAHDPAEDTPVDWMRIFAACLAHHRLELSAEEVVQLAIVEFQCGHPGAPEAAAARCVCRPVDDLRRSAARTVAAARPGRST